MADSYLAWKATIKSLSPDTGRMSVLYETQTPDSDRPAFYQSILVPATSWNDSDLRSLVDGYSVNAVNRWEQIIEANDEAQSAAFNDSDFVDLEITGTFKPTVSGTVVGAYNSLYYKVVETRVEGPTEITVNQSLVALDSDEKVSARAAVSVEKSTLFRALVRDGYYDSVEASLETGEPISASWNGSTAGSFDWNTDKIASRGVKNVSRVAEGIFEVEFSTALTDSNYTVLTGVGAEDYAGVSASPRQLTVIRNEMSPTSFQVVCERTDDAVNEDNAFFSVMVPFPSLTSSSEISWNEQDQVRFGDSVGDIVQGALSLNDSDFAAYLLTV